MLNWRNVVPQDINYVLFPPVGSRPVKRLLLSCCANRRRLHSTGSFSLEYVVRKNYVTAASIHIPHNDRRLLLRLGPGPGQIRQKPTVSRPTGAASRLSPARTNPTIRLSSSSAGDALRKTPDCVQSASLDILELGSDQDDKDHHYPGQHQSGSFDDQVNLEGADSAHGSPLALMSVTKDDSDVQHNPEHQTYAHTELKRPRHDPERQTPLKKWLVLVAELTARHEPVSSQLHKVSAELRFIGGELRKLTQQRKEYRLQQQRRQEEKLELQRSAEQQMVQRRREWSSILFQAATNMEPVIARKTFTRDKLDVLTNKVCVGIDSLLRDLKVEALHAMLCRLRSLHGSQFELGMSSNWLALYQNGHISFRDYQAVSSMLVLSTDLLTNNEEIDIFAHNHRAVQFDRQRTTIYHNAPAYATTSDPSKHVIDDLRRAVKTFDSFAHRSLLEWHIFGAFPESTWAARLAKSNLIHQARVQAYRNAEIEETVRHTFHPFSDTLHILQEKPLSSNAPFFKFLELSSDFQREVGRHVHILLKLSRSYKRHQQDLQSAVVSFERLAHAMRKDLRETRGLVDVYYCFAFCSEADRPAPLPYRTSIFQTLAPPDDRTESSVFGVDLLKDVSTSTSQQAAAAVDCQSLHVDYVSTKITAHDAVRYFTNQKLVNIDFTLTSQIGSFRPAQGFASIPFLAVLVLACRERTVIVDLQGPLFGLRNDWLVSDALKEFFANPGIKKISPHAAAFKAFMEQRYCFTVENLHDLQPRDHEYNTASSADHCFGVLSAFSQRLQVSIPPLKPQHSHEPNRAGMPRTGRDFTFFEHYTVRSYVSMLWYDHWQNRQRAHGMANGLDVLAPTLSLDTAKITKPILKSVCIDPLFRAGMGTGYRFTQERYLYTLSDGMVKAIVGKHPGKTNYRFLSPMQKAGLQAYLLATTFGEKLDWVAEILRLAPKSVYAAIFSSAKEFSLTVHEPVRERLRKEAEALGIVKSSEIDQGPRSDTITMVHRRQLGLLRKQAEEMLTKHPALATAMRDRDARVGRNTLFSWLLVDRYIQNDLADLVMVRGPRLLKLTKAEILSDLIVTFIWLSANTAPARVGLLQYVFNLINSWSQGLEPPHCDVINFDGSPIAYSSKYLLQIKAAVFAEFNRMARSQAILSSGQYKSALLESCSTNVAEFLRRDERLDRTAAEAFFIFIYGDRDRSLSAMTGGDMMAERAFMADVMSVLHLLQANNIAISSSIWQRARAQLVGIARRYGKHANEDALLESVLTETGRLVDLNSAGLASLVKATRGYILEARSARTKTDPLILPHDKFVFHRLAKLQEPTFNDLIPNRAPRAAEGWWDGLTHESSANDLQGNSVRADSSASPEARRRRVKALKRLPTRSDRASMSDSKGKKRLVGPRLPRAKAKQARSLEMSTGYRSLFLMTSDEQENLASRTTLDTIEGPNFEASTPSSEDIPLKSVTSAKPKLSRRGGARREKALRKAHSACERVDSTKVGNRTSKAEERTAGGREVDEVRPLGVWEGMSSGWATLDDEKPVWSNWKDD